MFSKLVHDTKCNWRRSITAPGGKIPPTRVHFCCFNNASVLLRKAKIDMVMDKTLDAILKPVKLAGGVAKRLTKAQRIAYGGGAAAVSTAVGGGVSMALLALSVPVVFVALLFLPLTLMGGVSRMGYSDLSSDEGKLHSADVFNAQAFRIPAISGVVAFPCCCCCRRGWISSVGRCGR